MARIKSKTPVKRNASSDWVDHRADSSPPSSRISSNGKAHANGSSLPGDASVAAQIANEEQKAAAGVFDLVVCVGGIYATFLAWAVLQERITTTPYTSPPTLLNPTPTPEIFNYSIALNTIQSSLAALSGFIYLHVSTPRGKSTPPVFPSSAIVAPLALVSVTSSLASPFGYASLKHVGYLTYILAKSCKLLPVMALHVTVFRKSYPLYKYAVVAAVTAGVALFTVQGSSGKGKSKSKATSGDANPAWGVFLLSINLLFDGLTNATQDQINARFAPFGGAQMMCAQNLISTLLTSTYLLAAPFVLAAAPALASTIGLSPAAANEAADAFAFAQRHPGVLRDVLGFAACGALGQVFIFMTLAKFSSLLLVTITVTRKMLSMLLSVVWFGHALSVGQWGGVALVFGGVGAEAAIGRAEKTRKEAEKKRAKDAKGQ